MVSSITGGVENLLIGYDGGELEEEEEGIGDEGPEWNKVVIGILCCC